MTDVVSLLEKSLALLSSYGPSTEISEFKKELRRAIVGLQSKPLRRKPDAWRARVQDLFFHAASKEGLVSVCRVQFKVEPDELEPLFLAKSPVCFGAEAKIGGRLINYDGEPLVSSERTGIYNIPLYSLDVE